MHQHQDRSTWASENTAEDCDVEPSTRLLHPRIAYVALALGLLFCAGVVSAQEPLQPEVSYEPGLYGIPLSDNLIATDIEFDNGDHARVVSREGTLITIKTPDYHFALAPQITSTEDIMFSVFTVDTVAGPRGGEYGTQIGTAAAALGHFSPDMSDLPFSLKPTKLTRPDINQNRNLPDLKNKAAQSACCAQTCSGVIVCGCGVETGCSFCCSGDCCDFDPSGPLNKSGLEGPAPRAP